MHDYGHQFKDVNDFPSLNVWAQKTQDQARADGNPSMAAACGLSGTDLAVRNKPVERFYEAEKEEHRCGTFTSWLDAKKECNDNKCVWSASYLGGTCLSADAHQVHCGDNVICSVCSTLVHLRGSQIARSIMKRIHVFSNVAQLVHGLYLLGSTYGAK